MLCSFVPPQNQLGNVSWWRMPQLSSYQEPDGACILLPFCRPSISCPYATRILAHTMPGSILDIGTYDTLHLSLLSVGPPLSLCFFMAASLIWGGPSAVPTCKQVKSATACTHAFAVVAPTSWNGLHEEVRKHSTLLAFCKLCTR